jgi:hypothetical protein
VSSSIPDPIPEDATPEQLRAYVNYWHLEAVSYAYRWNTALQWGDNMKAQNDRLRKAGDELARVAIPSYILDVKVKAIEAWLAAKGERP